METIHQGTAGDDKNANDDDSNKQPQIDDAKEFLEKVRDRFKEKPDVYNSFVEIMKNFKNDNINTGKTIDEVRRLFEEHPDLFAGFKNFLPAAGLVSREDVEIHISSSNLRAANGCADSHSTNNGHITPGDGVLTNTPPDFNMAVQFICRIKQRFGATRKIYQDFLSILQHFQSAAQANDGSVVKDVKMRIRALFRNHPDLLAQFDYFLPPLTAHFSRAGAANAAASASTQSSATADGSRKRGRQSEDLDHHPDPKRRRQNGDRSGKRRKEKSSDKHDEAYTLSGSDLGGGGLTAIKSDRSSRHKRKRDKKHRSGELKERDRESSLKARSKTRDGSKKEHKEGGGKDKDALYSDEEEAQFSDSDADVVDELNQPHQQQHQQHQVQQQQQQHSGGGMPDEHQGLRIFSRLRKDIPDALYRHILTLTQLYPMGLTEFNVVGKLICEALTENRYHELAREFQTELSKQSKQSWFFRSRGQNYYEYLQNNALLKTCKAVQSSYRELPQDVVQPRSSGRHPDAALVLNDYFVSKPTGGEGGGNNDNSAGGRLKNTFNESLQKSEDDLFELDMMIQTNDAARKVLEDIYKTVMQPKYRKVIKSMDSNLMELPMVERRAISRLYAEHGGKVLNLIKKMPETSIPVVLKRLRDKSQEWEQLKTDMKPMWKTVIGKNYYKAHDFRYTLFKSNDLKRIASKNLCKQIEERHAEQAQKNRLSWQHSTTSTTTSSSNNNSSSTSNTNTNTSTAEVNTTTTTTTATTSKDDKMEQDEDEEEDVDLRTKNDNDNNEEAKDAATTTTTDCLTSHVTFDREHQSASRCVDADSVDPFETEIATQQSLSALSSGFNGTNGVITGVGLMGNASHDHIIQQMSAGLHVELGDYVREPAATAKVNNHDYRFVMCKHNILSDCVELIFQKANKEEVGQARFQQKLFAEVMNSLFAEFFELNIEALSVRFLEHNYTGESDVDSDDEEFNARSEVDKMRRMGLVPLAEQADAVDPLCKVFRRLDQPDENEFSEIDMDKAGEDEKMAVLLHSYFDDGHGDDADDDKESGGSGSGEQHVWYGNRNIYCLFRYLHILYARMCFAFKLCDPPNPLYRWNKQYKEQEHLERYQEFLSHLSKFVNGQIEDEIFEDECRRLLGLKSYQLFTLNRVIHSCYKMVCEIDCDQFIRQYYRLFLHFKEKHTKQDYLKHYIAASKIFESRASNKDDELYQISLHNKKIVAISIVEPYVTDTVEDSNEHHDIEMNNPQ